MEASGPFLWSAHFWKTGRQRSSHRGVRVATLPTGNRSPELSFQCLKAMWSMMRSCYLISLNSIFSGTLYRSGDLTSEAESLGKARTPPPLPSPSFSYIRLEKKEQGREKRKVAGAQLFALTQKQGSEVQVCEASIRRRKYCCFCGGSLSTRAQLFLVLWGRWALPSLLSFPASCVRNTQGLG